MLAAGHRAVVLRVVVEEKPPLPRLVLELAVVPVAEVIAAGAQEVALRFRDGQRVDRRRQVEAFDQLVGLLAGAGLALLVRLPIKSRLPRARHRSASFS